MGIVVLVLMVIAYIIYLLHIIRGLKSKNSELISKNSVLETINEEYKSDIQFNIELMSKTGEEIEDIRKELTDARKEIWDYEIGAKTPTQKVKINEMKDYIFHLLQKQSIVMGLNDEDKQWIKRLGGQIQKEAIDE